jgi:DNA-binding MarR family transcriptional regulator
MSRKDVERVMTLYPRIFFACHTRHVRDERSGTVLTAHQASILDHLDERDAITVGELASHMGVTAGTMSVHLDRLERRGFVVRQRGEADGRQVELRLTADGVRVRDAKSVLDPVLVDRMLARLPATQRREAIHGLALLAEAATASMADRAGAGTGRRKHVGGHE